MARAVFVAAVALLSGLAVIMVMLRQPWMPGHFESVPGGVEYYPAPGETLVAPVLTAAGCGAPVLVLDEGDMDASPDLFAPAERTKRLARLNGVRCYMEASGAQVTGRDAAGQARTLPIQTRTRTFADLDMRFWPPWLIGVFTLLLSGATWSLRPKETATRLFALNGFALMVSSFTIALYAAHQPGSEPRLFWALLMSNQAANQFFYLSLIGLFLQYPHRQVGWGWATPLLALPFAFLAFMGWLPEWAGGLGLPAVELITILGLIGWQWVATRSDPRERAALMWLGLSVVFGCVLWLGLLASILVTGRTGDAGSILALVLVFPFYLGLAMGVARFCLVELQDWAFRILYFVIAAAVFIAFDCALIALLRVGEGTATGIALLVIAFGYLPLRDLVWRRLFKGRTLSRPAMFAAVMDVVFAPTPAARAGRWQGLLNGLFQPLSLAPADGAPAEAAISEGGLSLDVPAVAESPALRLSLARGGRELFSPSQLALVKQLIVLIRTAGSSRDAYERGAAEERLRLAQDLHDDVGARLMSGLASADARTRPLLHAALGDIRAIASGLAGKSAPLDRVLADIRQECVRRFEAAGLETTWPLWPEDAPLILLDYRLNKALASSLRETASNLIRHAGATQVTVAVRLDGDDLCLRVEDDGRGFSDAALSGEQAGQGMTGLQRRMAEAGGRARFGNREPGGAWVELRLPLVQKEAAA